MSFHRVKNQRSDFLDPIQLFRCRRARVYILAAEYFLRLADNTVVDLDSHIPGNFHPWNLNHVFLFPFDCPSDLIQIEVYSFVASQSAWNCL